MSDSRIALSRSRLIARDRLSGLRNARGSLRLTIWRNFQVLSRLSGLRPVGWHHQCSHAEPRSRATVHPVSPRGDHHMVPEPCCSARILIVDDEPAMVQLREQLLSHGGHTDLLGITDSRTVVERCDDFLPDLIMLDLRMPLLDGVEVLKRLKQRAELYLPVLVLTADVSRESKRAALEAGASDFVTKPFEQTELLLRVRNLIEMRFLHRDLRRQNQSLEGQIQERSHQLLEAEKLATMGNLLAGVAHELNSPLSVILGQVGLFATTGADTVARSRIKDIGEAAERCVRIVRSFLTMARRHPPERGHVSLNHLLRDAVELLAFELRIANVEMAFDLEKDLPLVWADGHQLKQVVVNLVTNARQAIQDT